MRALVVEDEPRLARNLARLLRQDAGSDVDGNDFLCWQSNYPSILGGLLGMELGGYSEPAQGVESGK